jgi:hypothetical protein
MMRCVYAVRLIHVPMCLTPIPIPQSHACKQTRALSHVRVNLRRNYRSLHWGFRT